MRKQPASPPVFAPLKLDIRTNLTPMQLIHKDLLAIQLIVTTPYVLGAETLKRTDLRPLHPSGKLITDIKLLPEAGAVIAVS